MSRFGLTYKLLAFACVDVVATVGFVREMARSPAAWPLTAVTGLAFALLAMAAGRKLFRMPRRPAIKSRLSNVAAGVVALGLGVVLLAITFQVLGDMMARVVPASWITTDTTGVPFHPNRPSLPLDGAMAFLLTLLLTPPVAIARAAFTASHRPSARS